MPLSLHAAYVPSALQMLGTAQHLVGKAEAWCSETGCSEGDAIGARLIDDMLPFTYQIKSVAEHTAGSIAGVRAGSFSPALDAPPTTFAALRDKLAGAVASLEALTEDEMEAMIGGDVLFTFKDMKIPFTAEDFLLSFSQPNYYFHAATAYDILRAKGVKIGKRDFSGKMRMKLG